jgi:hypothetical protein
MEKDFGKIAKNDNTDIIIRVDDFGGKLGLTIREFTNDTRTGYKGFTKSGTRIPADKFLEFREIINSIKLEDLKAPEGASSSEEGEEAKTSKPRAKAQKSLEENPDY